MEYSVVCTQLKAGDPHSMHFWFYLLEEYGVQQPRQLYKDPVRHIGSP